MRITITLDEDTRAIIQQERHPGETLRETINRLIRNSQVQTRPRPELPTLRRRLLRDITDVSATLADLDERFDRLIWSDPIRLNARPQNGMSGSG